MYFEYIKAATFVALIISYLWISKKNESEKFKHDDIRVITVNDKKSCINALNNLLTHNPTYVGYDCEWKANKVRGENNQISLIQIGHEKLIILIRIHLFATSIPMELISFLGNVNIIKCGVGINGDAKKLKANYNMELYGAVDINDINTNSSNYMSLERLSNNLLNKPMLYKHKINHRKWEDLQLNDIQMHYACDDAIVAYMALKQIIEIQYDNRDIMEICFGKIDNRLNGAQRRLPITNNIATNNPKYKNNTKLHRVLNNGKNNYLKVNKANGMITLLDQNGIFLSLLQLKIAKALLKRKIVKKIDLHTIEMAVDIKVIDADNNDMDNYLRIIMIPDSKCMVCGDGEDEFQCIHTLRPFQPTYKGEYHCDECNRPNAVNETYFGCRECDYDRCNTCFVNKINQSKIIDHLIWYFFVPKTYSIYAKSQENPYKILLCTDCNRKAVKIRKIYQNELFKLVTAENNEQFNKINKLFQKRNICHNLKHKRKRHSFTVEKQNEFVAEILQFCGFDEEERHNIFIKECDFNVEMNIDWWYNKNDYNYIIIRECIDKICKERHAKRQDHNNCSIESVWKAFNNRPIEFCEMWRVNFMKKMKPQCYNKRYPTLQLYAPHRPPRDDQFIVDKQCKHRILDCNGNVLTRCSRVFTDTVGLINDPIAQARYNSANLAKRVHNTKVQLLYPVGKVNVESDYCDVVRTIVWLPFTTIECYVCCKSQNETKLKIYNVFPEKYYDKLFGEEEKYNNYNMQCCVPLCLVCEMKAQQIECEFEYYLYLKNNLILDDDKKCDENNLELLQFYAVKISQKCERYKLALSKQNGYCRKILNYFGVEDIGEDEGANVIKECHCNKEMDIDWYYMKEYNYIIIKECIEKLMQQNGGKYHNQLCQRYAQNKLLFVSIWAEHFVDKMIKRCKSDNKMIGFEVVGE